MERETPIQEPSVTDKIKAVKPKAKTIKETRGKIRKHAGDLTSQCVYEEWLIYILWHKFNGRGSKKEVTNTTIEAMQQQKLLGDADFELVKSGETKASNTIAWGRNKLKDDGLISSSSPRGAWELTNKGIKKAQESRLAYKSTEQETDRSMPSHVAQSSKNLISKTEPEYVMICRNKASDKNFIYLEDMSLGNDRVVNPKGKIMLFDKGLFDELKENDIDYLLSQDQITKIQAKRYKQAIDEQIPISIKGSLKQNVDNPGNLTHTKILRGRIGRESVTKWSELVDTAHRLGFEHFGSLEVFKRNSLSNIFLGIKSDKGFRYLQDIGISIQGENANNSWRNALYLAKKLKVPIEISFEWRLKEDAAHPGQKGNLFWSPGT